MRTMQLIFKKMTMDSTPNPGIWLFEDHGYQP